MFRDRLQLSTSEATEEGLEKELRDLMLPDLDPIKELPGVEGGVMKLNCSCRLFNTCSYSSSVFLLSKMTLFILSTTSSICSTSRMRLTSWRTHVDKRSLTLGGENGLTLGAENALTWG